MSLMIQDFTGPPSAVLEHGSYLLGRVLITLRTANVGGGFGSGVSTEGPFATPASTPPTA